MSTGLNFNKRTVVSSLFFCAANKTIIFMNEEQIPTDFLEKMMRTSKFDFKLNHGRYRFTLC